MLHIPLFNDDDDDNVFVKITDMQLQIDRNKLANNSSTWATRESKS